MRTTAGVSVKFKSVSLGGLVAVLTLQWMAPAQDDLGRQVQAIFAESCYGCHGAGQQMGNLRLDSNPGKVVIPGDSAHSQLMKRITGAGGLARMPMGGAALSAEKIAVIGKWIDAGAVMPAVQRHWAFIPPVRPVSPSTTQPAWV